MTNEEKARELGQIYFPDEQNVWARPNWEAQFVENACLEMAAWMQEQMIKRIRENLYRHNCCIGATIGVEKAKQYVVDVEDFIKKIMEE